MNDNNLIKDIAIQIYSQANFDSGTKAPYQIAQDSVAYAMTLVDVFKKNNLL